MVFLIDGYNLMHAAGYATARMSAAKFDANRVRFLDWLADGAKGRATLRVVFDAQKAPRPSAESDHKGVRVRFAYGQTADDEIEALLAVEPHPGGVAVVSNDLRVREAGRRRGCLVRTCDAFTDWLIDGSPPPPPAAPPPPEKPTGPVAADEVDELLKAFAVPPPKRR